MDSVIATLGDERREVLGVVPWAVPVAISLDTAMKYLVYDWTEEPRTWQVPGERMIEGFLGLSEASPEQILTYTRQWGLLGICEHGLPATHSASIVEDHHRGEPPYRIYPGCDGLGAMVDGRWQLFEPIAAWHRLAGEAIEIVTAFDTLQAETDTSPVARRNAALKASRLQNRLNLWLQMGQVRPQCSFNFSWRLADQDAHFGVMIGGDGLFGAIAHRLLLTLNGYRVPIACRGCKEWFIPTHGLQSICGQEACHKRLAAKRSSDFRKGQRASAT